MKQFFTTLLALLCLSFSSVCASPQIVRQTINAQGLERTYYLYVPENARSSVPLIVLLHGSKRNGLSLVEKWQEVADREGVIVVGPDSLNSQGWSTPDDGPDFLHDLVENLKIRYPLDGRRVYLFGHSAGAAFALFMSCYESEYFAVTAIHAGAVEQGNFGVMDLATHKIPISIAVGTVDAFFPLPFVRATRDAFNKRGFDVALTEIPNHPLPVKLVALTVPPPAAHPTLHPEKIRQI
ncbi:alpha/beta hydrolase family esterase [Anthocerotibacter panamensis]|uniref:alpha/beta hydrolase family esterase n=1 Tax=Anthocerotibacter panamensis TaxID=2857077 RepID=UPI001C401738|nr:PHB depolymerase family esterase [Anthocerotibacter panamensis]